MASALMSMTLCPLCKENTGRSVKGLLGLDAHGCSLLPVSTGFLASGLYSSSAYHGSRGYMRDPGLCARLETSTILLARSGTDLPFDVNGFRVILYDDSIGGKFAVERELRAHLQHILGVPLTES